MSGTEQPASQEQAQKVNGVKENSHVQKKIDSDDKQSTQTSKNPRVIPKKTPTKPDTTTSKKLNQKKIQTLPSRQENHQWLNLQVKIKNPMVKLQLG